MAGEQRGLHVAGGADPIWALWSALPEPWRGPVIGGGDIEDWKKITENGDRRIDLTGLPDLIAAELAWMAHWQAMDGTRSSVLATNQLANILRRAIAEGRRFPGSIRAMDWETAAALQRWFYATRWKRLAPRGSIARLRVVFRFCRLALIAACHGGPWWELDEWHPRCDGRIPLAEHEPQAHYGCSPSQIATPWLREAVKWHLGTQLEAGVLRWSTVSQERMRCFHRFDRWISEALADPMDVLGDPAEAAGQAAAFRRWATDPANRLLRLNDQRFAARPVHPRMVNDDLRAVAELFGFVEANGFEARQVLGPRPWSHVTEAHAASWFRQVSRIPHRRELNDQHYVDDHALAQIPAALPLLGLAREETMVVTRGDGRQVSARGFDDPQAIRMILLQILTGRRSSEIRTCLFDCLSAVPDKTVEALEGQEIARFHYAQSKIDIAPDTILVDREVVAVIEEQRQWIRERFSDITPRHLFMQRTGNRRGDKPYPSGTYNWILREFSTIAGITDTTGAAVGLSHTHRFRHTRLTRLAELGLPVHVLQRYAGHATPSMTMHYIAARQEHAEQAFLATVKLRADGTQITFSRDDHDSMHLFNRADRFLPNGWCTLPPLQTCDKGNACLTCSVFVTDATHQAALERQLTETASLIERSTQAFADRHGRAMPEDNVWLLQRRAEHAALTKLLTVIGDNPDQAVQGAGCPTTPTGPVPLGLDLTRHRRTQT
ncbi:tyrosine-type recombinase/integrase [Mycobacterium sp.]|uniref:tyrosine-type recombinase/integrase n=1 Tax=Mycobacterium sp. TaxID=1785 RepID=UPI002613F86F|nr:tyrosine-type recombinase/integrase [Mycobacterium sp.]